MRSRTPVLLFVGLLVPIALATLAPPCSAIPAWSRRYGISCSDCHAFPSLQLTAMGTRFLQRGHRTEDDTSEKDFSKLLAAHVEWSHTVVQHEDAPFESPEFHFHAGGALSPDFSAYLDANLNSDFEAIYGQYTTPNSGGDYFTARAGKTIPVILREYAAGLTAAGSTPLIIGEATLGANPFTPTRDSFGADAGGQWKHLFVQAGVVNGEDVPDQALVGNHKDVFASAQVSMEDQPTGAGVYFFHGGYDLLTPDSTGASAFDRYDRGALFANYTQDHYRVTGAYLVGQDDIGGQVEKPRISGLYVQADVSPSSWLVPFARYDWVKTEKVADAATVKQETIGLTVAAYVTQVTGGRLTAEFARREVGSSTTNQGMLTLMFVF